MSEPKGESIKGLIIFVVIFSTLGIFSLGATFYFLDNWQDRGSVGDMFGSVNALFSGAALAGVIYAIFLQRRELQLQRRELELTREELHRSAEAQVKSEVALRQQIKEMQAQSELQVLPFVVVVKDDSYAGYVLWNAGNGTALNIRVESRNDESTIDFIDTGTSILTKDQKACIHNLADYTIENKYIDIIFDNISGKRYSTTGMIKDGRLLVIGFGPWKSPE